MNAKSKLWVPQLVFQATTQRFVEGGDFGVEGALQKRQPKLMLHAAIISARALKEPPVSESPASASWCG